jgi:hypothetical protein
MSFLVFCIDAPTLPGRKPDLSRAIPAKVYSSDAAIDAACKLINGGAVVWQIKGAEGFMMERVDIETEYSRRRETRITEQRRGGSFP